PIRRACMPMGDSCQTFASERITMLDTDRPLPRDISRGAMRTRRIGEPRISVVIPCFDQPDEPLGQCLESVVEQPFPDWETVVVDDGSIRANVADVVVGLDDARIRTVRH